jgi:hypothetical protein
MHSASSNLAPGTHAGVAQLEEAHRPSTSSYCSRFSNQVDASNRPGVGKCSRDGGSNPLGASKNHGAVVQWHDAATLNLTCILKCR